MDSPSLRTLQRMSVERSQSNTNLDSTLVLTENSPGCFQRLWRYIFRRSRCCSKCGIHSCPYHRTLIHRTPLLIGVFLGFIYITLLSLFVLFNIDRLEKSTSLLYLLSSSHSAADAENGSRNGQITNFKNVTKNNMLSPDQKNSETKFFTTMPLIIDNLMNSTKVKKNDNNVPVNSSTLNPLFLYNKYQDGLLKMISSTSYLNIEKKNNFTVLTEKDKLSNGVDQLMLINRLKHITHNPFKSSINSGSPYNEGNFSEILMRQKRETGLSDFKRKVRQTSEELLKKVKSSAECFQKIEDFLIISENLQKKMGELSLEANEFKGKVVKEMYEECERLIINAGKEKDESVNYSMPQKSLIQITDLKQEMNSHSSFRLNKNLERTESDVSNDLGTIINPTDSIGLNCYTETGSKINDWSRGLKDEKRHMLYSMGQNERTKPFEFQSVKVINHALSPTFPSSIPVVNSSGESINTSQQLTYSLPITAQPMCFYIPKFSSYGEMNHESQLPFQLVCTSIPPEYQFLPQNQFSKFQHAVNENHYHHKNPQPLQDQQPQQNICNQCILNPPQQLREDNYYERQQEHSEMVHVPTAMSSPNPYFPYFGVMSSLQPTFLPQTGNLNFQNKLTAFSLQPLLTDQSMYHHSHLNYAQPEELIHFNQLDESQKYNQVAEQPLHCTILQPQTVQFPAVPGVSETRQSEENKVIHQSILPDNSSLPVPRMIQDPNCDDGFTCTNGECVLESAVCNNRVECKDASDEMSCSCTDRIDKDRKCDGYFDCPYGEDELGCFGCQQNSFSCDDWVHHGLTTTCVPLEKRCDNVHDCPNGKDEKDCSVLVNSVSTQEPFSVSYTRGFLHHNWQGNWFPACPEPDIRELDWARLACAAEIGSDEIIPHIDYISVKEQYKGSFLVPINEKEFIFTNGCKELGSAAFVSCPDVPCGTRLNHEGDDQVDNLLSKRYIEPSLYDPNLPSAGENGAYKTWNLSKHLFYSGSSYKNKKYDNNFSSIFHNLLFNNSPTERLNSEDIANKFFERESSFEKIGNCNENKISKHEWLSDDESSSLYKSNYNISDAEKYDYANNKLINKLNKAAGKSFEVFDKESTDKQLDTNVLFNENLLTEDSMNQNNQSNRFKENVKIDGNQLLVGKDSLFMTSFFPDSLFPHSPSVVRVQREQGRVVGGRDSKPAKWPWIVALFQDGSFHCGGVIINYMWVMTAAHCVAHFSQHYYEIQAGVLRRYSFAPMEQTRTVVNIIIHEKYVQSVMQNDLALLHLGEPLQYNRWVRPVCLPFNLPATFPLPGTLCTAVGWGATVEHGPDPDHMREVEVPVLPICKHQPDREGAELCAGALEGGRDTCQGDSGGPLLCRFNEEEDKWFVAGIVSHGEGCARPLEPGAYTKVALFLDWIREKTETKMYHGNHPLLQCPGHKCRGGFRCIPEKMKCNGKVDCLLADDEIGCFYEEGFLLSLSLVDDNHNHNFLKKSEKGRESVDQNNFSENIQSTCSVINIAEDQIDFFNGNVSALNSSNTNSGEINNICNGTNTSKLLGNVNETSNNSATFFKDIFEKKLTPLQHCSSEALNNKSNESDEKKERVALSVISLYENKTELSNTSEPENKETVLYYQGVPNSNNSEAKETDYFADYNILNYDYNIDGQNKMDFTKYNISDYYYNENYFQNQTNVYSDNAYVDEIYEDTDSVNKYNQNSSLINYGNNENDRFYYDEEYHYANINGEKKDDNYSHMSGGFQKSKSSLNNYDYFYLTFHETESNNNSSANNSNSNSFIDKTNEFSKESNHSNNHYDHRCELNRKLSSYISHDFFPEDFDVNFLLELIKNAEDSHKYIDKVTNSVYLKPSYLKKLGVSRCWKNFVNVSSDPSSSQAYKFNYTKSSISGILKEGIPFWLFKCSLFQQYIPFYMKCDGKFDCEDSSDEINCTCWDTLLARHDNFICDGIIDCPDHMDEENCLNTDCSEKHFHSFFNNSQCKKLKEKNYTKTLSNGRFMKYDQGHNIQFQNEGIITEYYHGNWRPLCVSNDSSVKNAFKICREIGYMNYETFNFVMVNNSSLPLIGMDEQRQFNITSTNETDDKCMSLEVKCSGLKEITGLPWHAVLFVEGKMFASAGLITLSLLITDLKAVKNIDPRIQYVSASLGIGKMLNISQLSIYEQNIRVNYIQPISSGIAALHLVQPALISHSVKPLGIIFPQFDSNSNSKKCITIDYTSNSGFAPTELEFLSNSQLDARSDRHVLISKNSNHDNDNDRNSRNQDYLNTKSSFKITKTPEECTFNQENPWAGVIVCNSFNGWYAAATYHLDKPFCSNNQSIYSFNSLTEFGDNLMDVAKQVKNENDETDIITGPVCDSWRCPRGRCLDWKLVANGISDCEDGSDENKIQKERKLTFCKSNSSLCDCPHDMIQCRSGECIFKENYCNGIEDCLDGSDEMISCNTNCTLYLELSAKHLLCNGYQNCLDKSDENWELCGSTSCETINSFSCNSSNKCIPHEFKCDGEKDCPDGDDEMDCITVRVSDHERLEGVIVEQKFGLWMPLCFATVPSPTVLDDLCQEMGFSQFENSKIVQQTRMQFNYDAFISIIFKTSTEPLIFKNNDPILILSPTNKNCRTFYLYCI